MDRHGGNEEEVFYVFFVHALQAEELDSDEELEAMIARTEAAIDDCFRRRSKRVGIAVGEPGDKCKSKEERDLLSEKLGDGISVRAKRRKEIEEMGEEDIRLEIKKTEETMRGLRHPCREAGEVGWGACRSPWPFCGLWGDK
jgi:hypothetical protein